MLITNVCTGAGVGTMRESWKGWLSGFYVPHTGDLGFYSVVYGQLLGDFEQEE